MEVREDDEEFKNPVDMMFDELAEQNPDHFAVRQYAKYKAFVANLRLIIAFPAETGSALWV